MARPGGADYLNLTLASLLCQMDAAASSDDLRVCIAVYEVKGGAAGQLTPFERARRTLSSREDVIFVSGRGGDAGGSGASTSFRAAPSRLERTRQQTRDVARTLGALAPFSRRYYVLLEDDWLLCDGGLDALKYLVQKASAYQAGFSALRFSYGLNGLLLPNADVPALVAFLDDPAAEEQNDLPDAPVDHLAYRWLRGKYAGGKRFFGGRHMMAFRHTLFWHIGDASAVGNSKARHKPKCYGLTKEWLFEQESFHLKDCPDDDVWPCKARPSPGSPKALEVARLVAEAVASAPGARRCGHWRVCWGRPTAAYVTSKALPSLRAAQCAARFVCRSGAGAGSGEDTPCIAAGPEYEAGDKDL